ncbi:hypothetical protein [Tolypothrix sp. VBCCA 56010]|uniref:hypothetical protein n=1 Tax=Tolypothrix sp. VBCCA 56010 TaxID=3137731 RepID=UPI003D7E72EF
MGHGDLKRGKGKKGKKRIITNAHCPMPIAHCPLPNNYQPTTNTQQLYTVSFWEVRYF